MSRDPALRALILGSYLVVTAVSLVGCGDVDNSASSPSSPPGSMSPSTGGTAYPDEEFLGDYEGIPEDTAGPRTPSAQRQQDARKQAREALSAYYASGKEHEEWFEDLGPLLSREAQTAYETVDPASIPAYDVVGDPSVVRHSGGGAITIAVPTTAGDVQVDLIVEEAGHDWAVDRFRFPSAEN